MANQPRPPEGVQDHLLQILPRVTHVANQLCPALDFPHTEAALRRNIASQVLAHYERHRRVTMRNGRPSVHRLPAGIALGVYETQLAQGVLQYGIEIAHEGQGGQRDELLRRAHGGNLGAHWVREPAHDDEDWGVLASFIPVDGKSQDDAVQWFCDRLMDLEAAGILRWLSDEDQEHTRRPRRR